jgi:Putative Flp pilus-assembly TadE/G-like
MRRVRNERGQVLVQTVLMLTMLLGMTALVLDVGAWFRAKRQLQAATDAATLAGAQALPDAPGTASQLALQYGNANGGGVAGADVTISSTAGPNDTISVNGKKTAPGFFSKVFGVNIVNIQTHAKAIVGNPGQAEYVAPMVVSCDHPLIQDCDGKHTPVFGQTTDLNFDKFGAPGAFGMLDLSNSGGNVGSSTLGSWILKGYSKYLPLGNYDSDPGAKFNSANVSGSLDARVGTVLLFPVFDTLNGGGSNAKYNIIGWIGFHLTQVVSTSGTNATLRGYFTKFITHGILPKGGGQGSTNFGDIAIQLVE